MVTDEQYKTLEKKVLDLEKRFNMLAKQYTMLYMKNDSQDMLIPETSRSPKKRDVTRYVFRGKKLCKRQLVLEIVKWYVQEKKIHNSKELIQVFPDYIQGPLGIVRRIEEAEKYSNAYKRYYFNNNDVIYLEDGQYVVCSQWDVKNIKGFLALAEDLGLKIEIDQRKYH